MAFRGGLVCCARSIPSLSEAQCETSGIRLAREWQGGAMAHAARCIGLRNVLRRPMQRAAFFALVLWLGWRRGLPLAFLPFSQTKTARWNPPRSISCFWPYGRVCARLWGVSGVSLRSLTGSRCFSPGRRHPFRRGIRWRGGNPVSARSGACCSSRCGLWSRARGCLHPHRSG